jgi:hypothetical protein
MTPAEYRAKAEELLEQAKGAEPKGNPELVALALRYLRLADLAEKNAGTDIVYETPTVTVPMQQQAQPQQEQQQQAMIVPDKSQD